MNGGIHIIVTSYVATMLMFNDERNTNGGVSVKRQLNLDWKKS